MTVSGMAEVPARPGGLRERKKAKTRAAIREHAVRLFRQQGYDATTVEQISAAAEVSPATFFRYFPTKEDVVLQDDFDLVTVEALQAQPPDISPVAAIRRATAAARVQLSADDGAQLAETTRLTFSVPELRARSLDELVRTTDVIATAIAARTGRSPDDFAARNLAGAVIGVILAATMPLYLQDGEIDLDEMFDRIDAGLAHLEAGLPL